MRRLTSWSAEYGLQIAAGDDLPDEDDGSIGRFDIEPGRPWQPITPEAEPPAVIRIIDGVRRAEANFIEDDPDFAFGLCGSFAVGAVECGPGVRTARNRDIAVYHRYLQTGGLPTDLRVGTSPEVIFNAHVVQSDKPPAAELLMEELTTLMRKYEAILADQLAADEDALTIVDGTLRYLTTTAENVVGYVKSMQRRYLPPERISILSQLTPGQRTPVFELPLPRLAADRRTRCSWYLRLADLGPAYHPYATIARLEASEGVDAARAARLADRAALAIVPLASTPDRDPRAPQNLIPVSSLERELRHLLGDQQWMRRLIAEAV